MKLKVSKELNQARDRDTEIKRKDAGREREIAETEARISKRRVQKARRINEAAKEAVSDATVSEVARLEAEIQLDEARLTVLKADRRDSGDEKIALYPELDRAFREYAEGELDRFVKAEYLEAVETFARADRKLRAMLAGLGLEVALPDVRIFDPCDESIEPRQLYLSTVDISGEPTWKTDRDALKVFEQLAAMKRELDDLAADVERIQVKRREEAAEARRAERPNHRPSATYA